MWGPIRDQGPVGRKVEGGIEATIETTKESKIQLIDNPVIKKEKDHQLITQKVRDKEGKIYTLKIKITKKGKLTPAEMQKKAEQMILLINIYNKYNSVTLTSKNQLIKGAKKEKAKNVQDSLSKTHTKLVQKNDPATQSRIKAIEFYQKTYLTPSAPTKTKKTGHAAKTRQQPGPQETALPAPTGRRYPSTPTVPPEPPQVQPGAAGLRQHLQSQLPPSPGSIFLEKRYVGMLPNIYSNQHATPYLTYLSELQDNKKMEVGLYLYNRGMQEGGNPYTGPIPETCPPLEEVKKQSNPKQYIYAKWRTEQGLKKQQLPESYGEWLKERAAFIRHDLEAAMNQRGLSEKEKDKINNAIEDINDIYLVY